MYTYAYSSGENTFETLIGKKNSGGFLGPVYAAMAPMHHGLLYDLDLQVVDDVTQASFILNTGPEPLVLEQHIEWMQKARDNEVPMMCVNPDIHVIVAGAIKLCAGSLAEYYESIGGEVSYHGKPYPCVYESIFEKNSDILMDKWLAVGDSLSTDIMGAQNIGIDSALVLTGVDARALSHDTSMTAIERVKNRIYERDIYPTYIMNGFHL
jgi:HAD superfamily hydrolase (TIGR01459 family)